LALRLEAQRKAIVVVLAVAAIACAALLEATKTFRAVSGHAEKRAAVEIAQRGYDALGDYYRKDLGRAIDSRDDPAGSGLIGPNNTAIQNAAGNLAAKRTSINPNLAAVIVDYFQQIGLKRGDRVAVGLTGSYPGTNVALYAAMKAMDLKPTIVTALGSSGFGATDPQFTWLDMERVLADKGVVDFRSAAASPGGGDDMGGSKSAAQKDQIWAAISRNHVQELRSRNIDEAIEKRMEIFGRGGQVKAYVNVGASAASMGFNIEDVSLPSGLYRDLASQPINWPRQGPMIQLAKRGAPVINLGALQNVAREYGLSIAPQAMPQIGEGRALGRQGYNLPIVLIVCLFYVLLTLTLALPSWRRVVLRQQAAAPAAPPAQA